MITTEFIFPNLCLPSLSRAWALQAGGSFWSPQPRLLWLQRAKKEPLCRTLCGWNVTLTSLQSVWKQRWPAVSPWREMLACCWLLPNSSYALMMLFQSSAPPHCVSPRATKCSLGESLKSGFSDWCASLRCSLQTDAHTGPYWFHMINASCCSKLVKGF